jgi:hypothetical protein
VTGTVLLQIERQSLSGIKPSDFDGRFLRAGRYLDRSVILFCVRSYLAYNLNLGDFDI